MAKKIKYSDKNMMMIPLASTAILVILAFVISMYSSKPTMTNSKAAKPVTVVATTKPGATGSPKNKGTLVKPTTAPKLPTPKPLK